MVDTNVFWTKSASELASKQAVEVVERVRADPDYEVVWLIPSVVIQERTYQMEQSGIELAKNVIHLEALHKRSLDCGDEAIASSVRARVTEGLSNLGWRNVELDLARVGWADIVSAALFRRPPFERSTEKGFRDALVCATVAQVAKDEFAAGRDVLVVVSQDKFVREALEGMKRAGVPAQILDSLAGFEALVRQLRVRRDLEWVERTRDGALEAFIGPGDCIWDREDLGEKVKQKLVEARRDEMSPALVRVEASNTRIEEPQFLSREAGRMRWLTRVKLLFTAWSLEVDYGALSQALLRQLSPLPSGGAGAAGTTQSIASATAAGITQEAKGYGTNDWWKWQQFHPWGDPPMQERISRNGEGVVEIRWSVAADDTGNVTDGRLEEVSGCKVVWE